MLSAQEWTALLDKAELECTDVEHLDATAAEDAANGKGITEQGYERDGFVVDDPPADAMNEADSRKRGRSSEADAFISDGEEDSDYDSSDDEDENNNDENNNNEEESKEDEEARMKNLAAKEKKKETARRKRQKRLDEDPDVTENDVQDAQVAEAATARQEKAEAKKEREQAEKKRKRDEEKEEKEQRKK